MNVAASRRRTIRRMMGNQPDVTILELGPLDNPTYLPAEGGVFYFDVATKSELQQRHPQRHVERMVEVDYVLRADMTILDTIQDRRFDLIVGNHVVEHAPDLIGWLNQMDQLTVANGGLFLSVPDRRYTFDYYRFPSDAIEAVRAMRRACEDRPGTRSRGSSSTKQISVREAWAGRIPAYRTSGSLKETVERAKRAARSTPMSIAGSSPRRPSRCSSTSCVAAATFRGR